jgi:hypothetical protein
MNDEKCIQPTIEELASLVGAQQRQIAALTAALGTARARSRFHFVRASRTGISGIVALCLGLLLGTVALAAIPGSGGVITSCYDTKNGTLRVIDARAGKTCKRDEKQLTWN